MWKRVEGGILVADRGGLRQGDQQDLGPLRILRNRGVQWHGRDTILALRMMAPHASGHSEFNLVTKCRSQSTIWGSLVSANWKGVWVWLVVHP